MESRRRALLGVTSAEGKAELARLEAELAEKEETRDDTIKDHIYQLQVDGLDDLKTELTENYEKYVEQLTKSVDDIEKILGEVSDTISSSASEVSDTINKILAHYGVTTSDLGLKDDIPHAATGGLVKATKRAGDDGLATLAIGEEVATADVVKQARKLIPTLDQMINNQTLTDLANGKFTVKIPTLEDNQLGYNEFTINFDDAIRIDNIADLGNISDEEFKRLLEEGYKYTSQKIAQEIARVTGKRPAVR